MTAEKIWRSKPQAAQPPEAFAKSSPGHSSAVGLWMHQYFVKHRPGFLTSFRSEVAKGCALHDFGDRRVRRHSRHYVERSDRVKVRQSAP